MDQETFDAACAHMVEHGFQLDFTSYGGETSMTTFFFFCTGHMGGQYQCGCDLHYKMLLDERRYVVGDCEKAPADYSTHRYSDISEASEYAFENDLDYEATFANLADKLGDCVVVDRGRKCPCLFFDWAHVYFSPRELQIVAIDWKIAQEVAKCLVFGKNKPTREMGYVVATANGEFDRVNMEVKKQDVAIGDNYNDDLPDEAIAEFVNGEQTGVVILHGVPGTGKTSYLRDLIYRTNKKFLFMDKSAFQYIGNSTFIEFLMNHRGSVIVLEDCENLLVDRQMCDSALGALLNLSDGILGDALKLKFICTFNADLEKIDPAVLRKGRLRMKYEFRKLTLSKTKRMCGKLGVNPGLFPDGALLCDIYNANDNGVASAKKAKIGF